MASLHFRNARVYLAPTSAAAAVPIQEAHSFELSDVGADLEEDPAFGDNYVTQLGGLIRWGASLEANWDTGQTTIHDAATQNLGPVRFYGYPDQASASRFYSGLVWVKYGGGGTVTTKGNVSVTLTGDGPIATA